MENDTFWLVEKWAFKVSLENLYTENWIVTPYWSKEEKTYFLRHAFYDKIVVEQIFIENFQENSSGRWRKGEMGFFF